MLIRKYEPRRATPEEARRYFLRYYCNAPDALFGSIMDKEGYLNAGAEMWLDQGRRLRPPPRPGLMGRIGEEPSPPCAGTPRSGRHA